MLMLPLKLIPMLSRKLLILISMPVNLNKNLSTMIPKMSLFSLPFSLFLELLPLMLVSEPEFNMDLNILLPELLDNVL